MFLAFHRITVRQLAASLGCNHCYLSRIINGHVFPGKLLSKEITKITNGEVKLPARPKKIKKEKKAQELELLMVEKAV